MLALTSGFFRGEDACQWRDTTRVTFKWLVSAGGDASSAHQVQIVRPVMGVWFLQTTSVSVSQDTTTSRQQRLAQDAIILATNVTAHIVVAVYNAMQPRITDI